MTTTQQNKTLYSAIETDQANILTEWIAEQKKMMSQYGQAKEQELTQQCQTFLQHFLAAIREGNLDNMQSPEWRATYAVLEDVATIRGEMGLSPSETATFVFSFKRPLFASLARMADGNAEALAAAVWEATTLLDRLGLYTTEVYTKIREGVIARQQEDMLELSTPVVTLAPGILALPLIGTLDSARTQVVMETLLQTIMETGSTIAIIDITGVPTVDTLVAQHLLKTVTAARLMGADCIISGIRPQIAQTIVHLGVELGDIATKATLAGAFKLALDRSGLSIVKTKPALQI
ncbi:STAS domain-containing protein [Asticcacaulis tiandongensis]|uniref:STAS domain-containing protein n=1 Tax=Asticcacaulis tiandongensis TaxID=2565365 RepID=UPI0011288A8B|nr:STAS domain-containing protein [Asticcacaulis tiandongensis]